MGARRDRIFRTWEPRLTTGLLVVACLILLGTLLFLAWRRP